MIYASKFTLSGTTQQKTIVKDALDKIFFPWDKLTFPREPVEIGWRDLNSGSFLASKVKKHQGPHPGGEDKPDYIQGVVEERKYTLGVFYTGSGRIYIDNRLVNYPEIAAATVSAEIAHAVDYFLPLTDAQRKKIMTLMHMGNDQEHGHSWWEKLDYGLEYYDLVGEAFMQAFTVGYSDIPFGNADDFTHGIKLEDAPELRKIMGVERTDYVPTEIMTEYEVFGQSKVYHRMSHYKKPGRDGTIITDPTGYRPCKVCRPDQKDTE